MTMFTKSDHELITVYMSVWYVGTTAVHGSFLVNVHDSMCSCETAYMHIINPLEPITASSHYDTVF